MLARENFEIKKVRYDSDDFSVGAAIIVLKNNCADPTCAIWHEEAN
jgi:hypothetical protein